MIGVADVLLANLDAAYTRKGWHGPTLRGSLRGLTYDVVSWRPAPRRHSIAELAMHCAYWKYAVRRKLTGAKRGSFPVKGSNWFSSDDRNFGDIVKLLDDQHELLRTTIESLPRAAFGDAKKLRLIYGVAAHDLYHAGQIQLIKKLYES
jgi:DinB superfamily